MAISLKREMADWSFLLTTHNLTITNSFKPVTFYKEKKHLYLDMAFPQSLAVFTLTFDKCIYNHCTGSTKLFTLIHQLGSLWDEGEGGGGASHSFNKTGLALKFLYITA